ncbi:hypothetical protein JD292_01430 [Leucobacter sp. CSA2]|uniref:Uncharacterized protein n=1 Tax=Leucobacter edaphi TaxID=2796472 RepID=A0A934QAE8_9MICO|nr:hypothetical protein [Leucobacter edaphi]MBK0420743.1 hypothetical protein [Leucobacter edaphi]
MVEEPSAKLHDVWFIDGRSGSGKTSLADDLIGRLTAAGHRVAVLRVEDLYPGWDGLAAGSAEVANVLHRGSYARWDWHAGLFGERISLPTSGPLVIEGCGAITAANLAAAASRGSVHSIWLDCPEPLRHERAIARDGETFAPHWERWARQEHAHFGRHAPWLIADEHRSCGG